MANVCLVTVESINWSIYFLVEDDDNTFSEENIVKVITDDLDGNNTFCGELDLNLEEDCIKVEMTPENEFDFSSCSNYEFDEHGQLVMSTGVYSWEWAYNYITLFS